MSYMWSILVLLLIGHGFAGTGDMLVPASQSQMLGDLQELSEEELLEHVKAISLQDAPTDFRAALAEIQSSLGEWGLCLRDVPADGNCQFHAIVASGNLDMSAQELRAKVTEHLRLNAEHFSQYILGDWGLCLQDMGRPDFWMTMFHCWLAQK